MIYNKEAEQSVIGAILLEVEKGYIKYTTGDQSRPAVFEMVSRVRK